MQVTMTQCDGSGPGRHQMHRGPMSEVNFESNQRLPEGRQAKRRKIWYEEGDVIDTHREGYGQTG